MAAFDNLRALQGVVSLGDIVSWFAAISRLEERLRQAEANVFEKFQRFFMAEYGGEVSRADEDLGGFLSKIGLSVHHEALEEMGARRISDLIHLEEPDLESLGMSRLQKRKMMRAVHELRVLQRRRGEARRRRRAARGS